MCTTTTLIISPTLIRTIITTLTKSSLSNTPPSPLSGTPPSPLIISAATHHNTRA
eukprot:m.170188 g.170188  ORF g.170188 m.170188 type:complete len:55 (-) comp31604_c1_seq7:60-224(-)